MTLEWKGHLGNLVAVGRCGIYTIQTVSTLHVLQGVGHDDLPMLTLPSLGRGFGRLGEAKQHADRLDTFTAPEPQASGE